MKLSTIAAAIPVALAAPIETRSEGLVLNNLGLFSLVTEVDLQYDDGFYNIFAIDDNSNKTITTDGSSTDGLEKMKFPAPGGVLTVLDGAGKLVGTIFPASNNFGISFDDDWIANPFQDTIPQVVEGDGVEKLNEVSKAKRAKVVKPKVPKMKKFGRGGGGRGKAFAKLFQTVVEIIGNKLKGKSLEEPEDPSEQTKRGDTLSEVKRDDDNQIFMPVLVQGPGVTFASLLGLDQVIYDGDAITLIADGDIFIDIDNVVDFKNCTICNFPTSS